MELVEEECRLCGDQDPPPGLQPAHWNKFCSDSEENMHLLMADHNVSSPLELPRSQPGLAASRNQVIAGFLDTTITTRTTTPTTTTTATTTTTNTTKTTTSTATTITTTTSKTTVTIPSTTTTHKDFGRELEHELETIIMAEELIIKENMEIIKSSKKVNPTEITININIVETTEETPEISTIDPIIQLIETAIELPNSSVRSNQNILPIAEEKNQNKDSNKGRKTKKKKKVFTSAELLRMCFETGIGCNFGRNNLENLPSTTTTPTTSSSAFPAKATTTRLPDSQRELLRRRVTLCFTAGICGPSEKARTSRRPRVVTSATQTTRPAGRAGIEERARACFFYGDCG